MAKLSGKALDRLNGFHLIKECETIFMDYFRVIIKDKNPEVRKSAAYNLPCFNMNFRTLKPENA
jgi:hypothetical protein